MDSRSLEVAVPAGGLPMVIGKHTNHLNHRREFLCFFFY